MKKNLFLSLILFIGVSCQNEDITTTSNNDIIEPKIHLVQITNDNKVIAINSKSRTNDTDFVLKFDSKETYYSVLDKFKKMSVEEKIKFTETYGLESLQKLSDIADRELEEIGATATNDNDFRNKYAVYKNKYKDVLISNIYNNEDLSLYVPCGDDNNTFLIGKSHKIVIEDEVKEIVLSPEMGKSDKTVFGKQTNTKLISRATEPTPLGENHFNTYYENNNRKVTFDIYIDNYVIRSVAISLGAQKKMWYGWKRDDRDFYVDFDINNFVYMSSSNGHDYQINKPDKYIFKNTGGKAGAAIGNIIAAGFFTKGKAYVWTDRLTEAELVATKIIENGKLVESQERKCLVNKSLIATVNLEAK